MESTVIVALMGITGTLLAAVVTIAYNSSMEKSRWEREDRVRYQQERYRTYAEFHKAAWALTAKLETWLIGEVPDFIQEDEEQLLSTLIDITPRIELIGSKPVQDAATEFMRVAHGGIGGNIDNSPYARTRFNTG